MERPAILCVDDERSVLVSLREQLRRRLGGDFLIETADDGASALEVLEELAEEGRVVPVVISDHVMPGMKGDEFLSRVHAAWPDTATIMLTGNTSTEAVVRAVNEASLFRFLGKPWEEEDLCLTVRTAADRFFAGRRLAEQQAALRQMNDLALDLAGQLAATDRYRRLVHGIADGLPAEWATLFGVQGGRLRRLSTWGEAAADTPRRLALTAGSRLHGATTAGSTRFDGDAAAALADELAWSARPKSAVAVPLAVKDEVVGLLVLASGRRELLAVPDERWQGFGALAAASMRTARLVDDLEQASARRQRVADTLERNAAAREAGPLEGESEAILAFLEELEAHRGAGSVLLSGPSGAGHDAAARHLHRVRGAAGPFLAVEGPTVTDGRALLASGDDATSTLGLARGGTLFISNVEALSPGVQQRLAAALGSLAEGTQVVASTTREPEARRLVSSLRAVWGDGLRLPSLAERRDDIQQLAGFFAAGHAKRLGRPTRPFSATALRRLEEHGWPGNVAELRGAVERAVLSSAGAELDVDDGIVESKGSAGSYRLIDRLGAGQMGEVWRARHRHLARPAAVKLIRPDRRWNATAAAEAIARFQREAQATAALRSPHTVELFDFGLTETGELYYVMELLDGIDLQELVTRHGPMAPERVAHLMGQACWSLAEAHAAGLVHRDVKPANLYLCRLGAQPDVLKVLDFGMVTAPTGDVSPELSQAGGVYGTPAFMAPEQLRNSALDGRSDLYGLGCTAFYLLTGRQVFEATSAPMMMMHHLRSPPVAPSTLVAAVPPELDAVILECLEKDPAGRPASSLALLERLEGLVFAEPWTRRRAEAWWAASGHEGAP